MEVIDCIKSRRSVRNYINQEIEVDIINKIIEAGICAPSGKNGQPWRFKIVTDKYIIHCLSELSIYKNWMQTSACFIVVFLDNDFSYNYVKDVQSCGAAIQNMMLTAHSLGIGSCWIGEILPKGETVKEILQITKDSLELMAIITLGYSSGDAVNSGRKKTELFLL